MKKIQLFFNIILVSFFSIEAQTNWIEIKAKQGNFFLSFPDNPVYKFETYHDWHAYDKNKQVTYYMSYQEFPSNIDLSIQTVEEYLLPSLMEEDIQVFKKYMTYSGCDALEFLYKTSNHPVMYMNGRIIIRGQKLYILQVHYYHKELVCFDKFSNSLRFY